MSLGCTYITRLALLPSSSPTASFPMEPTISRQHHHVPGLHVHEVHVGTVGIVGALNDRRVRQLVGHVELVLLGLRGGSREGEGVRRMVVGQLVGLILGAWRSRVLLTLPVQPSSIYDPPGYG